MSNSPLLSVFIRAYNGERFIREAVESALDNGFADSEVIVLDDCSTDATVRIVESIRHPALRLVRNAANLGFVGALNAGMTLSRGVHVALLDHDDVALPGRFAQQVELLESAAGPDIVGGAVECFGDREGAEFFPASDEHIKGFLLFDCAFALPAVAMRLEPFRDGRLRFREEAGPAADFALWIDAMFSGLRLANLAEPLIRYRRHAAAASVTRLQWMTDMAQVQRRRVVDDFFPALPEGVRETLAGALSRRFSNGGQRWLDGVYAIAQAAALVDGVTRTDPCLLKGMLESFLVNMIGHAVKNGIVGYETLETMTDENEYFGQWRMADRGRLDARIMALFA